MIEKQNTVHWFQLRRSQQAFAFAAVLLAACSVAKPTSASTFAHLCDQPSCDQPCCGQTYCDQLFAGQTSCDSGCCSTGCCEASCGVASACTNCSKHLGLTCGDCVSSKLPLDRHKKSFFQLWESESAYITAGDEFDMTEVNTFVRVAVPLDGTMDNIIAFQPGLRTYHLNGPEVVDVPETLYDAQLSIVWRKTYNDRWQSSVWLQPKVRSDFETSKDSFFFSGGAYAKYIWNPNVFELYIGAFYLDRDDVSVLPAVGFVWTPTPDWRYEMLLPRPKIAKRLSRYGDCSEKWAYLSGQLGGGSFAVQRAAGNDDKVTVRDLRLFLGVESVHPGGAGRYLEVGYVFNRGIEYKRADQEFEFDDALMLRAGIRY